ncbi:hypothetical protein OFC58_31155, partial [Escherichia coli]|nr:hypothetical protein [Escherichia coli]
NKGNGKQSYNGYTNATSEDVTEQYQVGIKHIWEMQTALADSLTWQLDWLSKEENGITDRVKGQNIQRKDYIYEDEGYQFDSQFDKYLSLG